MSDEPIRPDYKRTEATEIPEDWERRPISSFSGFITKGATPTTYGFRWQPDGVLFLRSECVSEHGLDLSQAMFISPSAHVALLRGEVKSGDILITITGNVGRVVHLRANFGYANINQHIARIRINAPEVLSEYVYHWLSRRPVRVYYLSITTGQAYPQISLQQVRDTLVPIPSLPEQVAIAETLSDVDALLDALDRLIAKKRAVKQGAMQALLTGGVRLPGFAGTWEYARLGDLGKCLRGVSYKGETDLFPYDTPESIRLLRANNLQNASLDLSDLQYVNRKCVSTQQVLHTDDIVICMANGSKDLVGKTARFDVEDAHDYTYGAFMGCFRVMSEQALPLFISLLLQGPAYQNHIFDLIAGSSINNLKPSDIESVQFQIPPISEQAAIAEVLSDMDAEIDALEKRRAKLRDMKHGMMQELLTGRIRLVQPKEQTKEAHV